MILSILIWSIKIFFSRCSRISQILELLYLRIDGLKQKKNYVSASDRAGITEEGLQLLDRLQCLIGLI